MRPTMHQLGIMPELDSEGPKDYGHTIVNPLSRQVWLAVHDAGTNGLSAHEISLKLGKTVKSVAGRCTELVATGYLRRTEANRRGVVYVITEEKLR